MYSGKKIFWEFSNVSGFEGWLIARLDIVRLFGQEGLGVEQEAETTADLGTSEEENIEKNGEGMKRDGKAWVRKRKKNFAVLEASDGVLNIRMYLMKPADLYVWKASERENGERKNSPGGEQEFGRIVTAEEWSHLETVYFTEAMIREFVRDVGDTNPIHQTEQPVVPGGLLLEHLLGRGFLEELLSGTGGCRMIFREPLYGMEGMKIYQNRENGELCGFRERAAQGCCLWNVQEMLSVKKPLQEVTEGVEGYAGKWSSGKRINRLRNTVISEK